MSHREAMALQTHTTTCHPICFRKLAARLVAPLILDVGRKVTTMRSAISKLVHLAVLAFTGCAADGRLPGTHVLTVATVGDVVLVGFSNSHGTVGSFELTSVHGRPMTCQGRFRYSALPRGTARFSCTNGESGMARIEAGKGLSGTGTGESSLGIVHIVYGYSIDEINAKMRFPEDRVLVQDERGIGLVTEGAL